MKIPFGFTVTKPGLMVPPEGYLVCDLNCCILPEAIKAC